jgi:uncharacterized protein YukE
MRYDVLELRQVANKMSSASEAVGGTGCNHIVRVQNSLAVSFRGEAADALNEELSSLRKDLRQLTDGLAAISGEIKAFARRLELADAELTDFIQKK